MKTHKATVLVVDDEEMLRQFMARVLQQKGYEVLTASDGAEALHICEERHEEIDLLLTDITMPQMSGDELAEKALVNWPEIRTLMVSGYSHYPFLHNPKKETRPHFLQKPFTSDELAGKVEQVLSL